MAEFRTIKQQCTGEFKDKGSKFIAYAQSCYTEEDAKKLIDDLRKQHHKARHVCYAFKIGLTDPLMRMNDDGEPSNTGGQPIMNYIRKYRLDNVAIAVVRYFGGTLLGKGGLIKAYGGAAEEAIKNADIIRLYEKCKFNIIVPFSNYAPVLDTLKAFGADILNEKFDSACHMLVLVNKDSYEELHNKLLESNVESIELIS
ncbi:IMPACT family protein [Bacteroidota bacterium]